MKVLIVLIVASLLALAGIRLATGHYDVALAGRTGMAVMMAFTSIGHFAYVEGMAMMMPSFVPWKKGLVVLTGIIELAAAVGLLIPSLTALTAWLLILFFVLILPANINAAAKKVDFQKATLEGPGTGYLWFRVPLQLLFIFWTYLCAIAYS